MPDRVDDRLRTIRALCGVPQDLPMGRRPGLVVLRGNGTHAIVEPSAVVALREIGGTDDPYTAICLRGGGEFYVCCPLAEVLSALGEPWASLAGDKNG